MDAELNLEKLAQVLTVRPMKDLERVQSLLNKIREMKLLCIDEEELEAMEEDREASEELKTVRLFLSDSRLDLTGPESVLMGSFFKHLENVELLDTRALNVTLDSYDRKPSNTTSTVEGLEKKGLMEFVSGEDLHAHKTFRLTQSGWSETRDLLGRLKRKKFVAIKDQAAS